MPKPHHRAPGHPDASQPLAKSVSLDKQKLRERLRALSLQVSDAACTRLLQQAQVRARPLTDDEILMWADEQRRQALYRRALTTL